MELFSKNSEDQIHSTISTLVDFFCYRDNSTMTSDKSTMSLRLEIQRMNIGY